MDFTKVLIVCDGSIASAVLLMQFLKEKRKENITAIYPDFGLAYEVDKHHCAVMLGVHLDIVVRTIDLTGITEAIGFGYFKTINGHDIALQPRMPFRNGIVISAAVAYAYARGIRVVYVPSTKSDEKFDTVTDFDVPMANAVIAGTDGQTIVLMPYERDELELVLQKGVRMAVPFDMTNSCYHALPVTLNNVHCGVCDGCLERKNAFDNTGCKDPTRYSVVDSPEK